VRCPTLLLASSSNIEDAVSKTKNSELSSASTSFTSLDVENKSPTRSVEVTRIASSRNAIINDDDDDDDHEKENDDGCCDDVNFTTEQSIPGLLSKDTFDLSCRIHCTLILLCKHLPNLLELPSVSSATAKWIYAPNVTITGPKGEEEEQFAEGIDEILLLNRALATAATAARRAGSFLDLAIGTTTTSESSLLSRANNGLGRVECELFIDPNDPLKLMVVWQTRLPSTEFMGKSTITLSRDTGLVSTLQINEVKINGVAIILASLRRAAKSALATQSISEGIVSNIRRSSGNALLDGILNGIKDVVEAVDALPSSSSDEMNDGSTDASMYIVPPEFWDAAYFPVESSTALSMSNDNSTFIPVLIDQFRTTTPVVGSTKFVKYAIMHKSLSSFAKFGLDVLAGNTVSTDTEDVRTLFTTDAELVTYGNVIAGSNDRRDYITLLRGAGKLADFFRSLALFRDSTRGDWQTTSMMADMEKQQLIISWKTETPLRIEGTDSFIFESPTLSSSQRLPLCSDGNAEEVVRLCSSYFNDDKTDIVPVKIRRIESNKFIVAGVTADSAWAQTFVSAALRSGLTENTPLPDTTIIKLLRSLTSQQKKSPTTMKNPTTSDSPFPSLDDDAAISFYNILRALHNDILNIATVGFASTPADEYLTDTIELRGLLGEVLVRDQKNYRRVLGIVTSSLRAGVQTNTIRLATKPRTVIEVTSYGSIKVNLILALWITAPQLPLGGMMRGQSSSSQQQGEGNNQGFGAPLKIDISSEYIIDSTGRISQHKILESRLNGVLTPGDLLSRWIKDLTREEGGSTISRSSVVAPSSQFDNLLDVIAWVRSIGKT